MYFLILSIKDHLRLSEYSIRNGATLKLIMSPCFVHIQGIDAKMYEATVESNEPDVSILIFSVVFNERWSVDCLAVVLQSYSVADLYKIVETSVGHSMSDYQLYHKGRLVDRAGHKTLRDFGIKARSTLMVAKKKAGFYLDITNPLVSNSQLLAQLY